MFEAEGQNHMKIPTWRLQLLLKAGDVRLICRPRATLLCCRFGDARQRCWGAFDLSSGFLVEVPSICLEVRCVVDLAMQGSVIEVFRSVLCRLPVVIITVRVVEAYVLWPEIYLCTIHVVLRVAAGHLSVYFCLRLCIITCCGRTSLYVYDSIRFMYNHVLRPDISVYGSIHVRGVACCGFEKSPPFIHHNFMVKNLHRWLSCVLII